MALPDSRLRRAVDLPWKVLQLKENVGWMSDFIGGCVGDLRAIGTGTPRGPLQSLPRPTRWKKRSLVKSLFRVIDAHRELKEMYARAERVIEQPEVSLAEQFLQAGHLTYYLLDCLRRPS